MNDEEKRDIRGILYSIVESIEDEGVREFTLRMLVVAPSSFWLRPASREHHPEDERGECGDLIHSIRVAKTASILCYIPNIKGITRDIVISAATLHDACRRGLDDESDHTVDEHAQLVRKLAVRHDIDCLHSPAIFGMIEDHMGRWGASHYMPALDGNAIIHIADVICARVAEILNKEEW